MHLRSSQSVTITINYLLFFIEPQERTSKKSAGKKSMYFCSQWCYLSFLLLLFFFFLATFTLCTKYILYNCNFYKLVFKTTVKCTFINWTVYSFISFFFPYEFTFLGILERRYVKKKTSDDTSKTSAPQQDGPLLSDNQLVPTQPQDMPTLPMNTPMQPMSMPIATLKTEPEEESMYW